MVLIPELKLNNAIFAQYVGVIWHKILVIAVDFTNDIGTYAPPKNPKTINNVFIILDATLLSLKTKLMVTPKIELKIIKEIKTIIINFKSLPQLIFKNIVLTK